jgi:DNA-binding CsgD family transcriptional regulator
MLLASEEGYAFRHELARQAVLQAIGPHRLVALHRQVLAALRAAEPQPDLARLAHHAEAAGDQAAVLELAPAAARQPAAAQSFREAAALFRLALRYRDALPAQERALLLEEFARYADAVDQRTDALAARREAAGLWRQLGDPLKEGANHALQVVMLIGLGRTTEAQAASQAALALLAGQPSIRHVALANSTQATLCLFDCDYAGALAWCDKTFALPGIADQFFAQVTARTTRGAAWMHLDYERGRAELEQVLGLARQGGADVEAGNILTNLGTHALEVCRLRDAEQYLAEALAYTTERDIDILRLVVRGAQAGLFLRLGHWDLAAEAASDVVHRPGASAVSRMMALEALGLLRARRGDPGAGDLLAEALDLAGPSEHLPRLAPIRAARAEAAWLAGNHPAALDEARTVYPLAVARQHAWLAGALALWQHRLGHAIPAPEWLAPPYAQSLAGDWRAAAAEWQRLGCPYEQALALSAGDHAAQLAALDLFDRLGARPAADLLRHRLQTAGAAVPRGPRPATRRNPYALTTRQVEILRLLAAGHTNPEIALRLHLSPKTVEHHVSAVLAKLDVPSRDRAAALARQHLDP